MSEATSQLAEEEEKAKTLSKTKNKQEMMLADLEGEERARHRLTVSLSEDTRPAGGSRWRKHPGGHEQFAVLLHQSKQLQLLAGCCHGNADAVHTGGHLSAGLLQSA